MGKARRSRGRGFGWALGVLAVLTLALAAPQHVLDFDEASDGWALKAVIGVPLGGR